MVIRQRIGIIGAGVAGITLARSLSKIADVSIFEKSKGVGGRVATRRSEDAAFDHGAQYFTIRDDRFRNALEAACLAGSVQTWNGDLVYLGTHRDPTQSASKTPRYVGCPSMNALPKAMSEGLNVLLNVQISAITGEPGQWYLQIGDEREGPFDWLISTAPAPQSAALLPSRFEHHDALSLVKMNACFTLMVRPTHGLHIPFAAARVDDPVIDWICRNESKPDRPETPGLVVNSNPVWADTNIDRPLDVVQADMIDAIRRYIPIEYEAAVIHRWRYANVQRPVGKAFLLDRASQLAACGDWCIGGRVEAAFLSGAGLGDALQGIIEGVQ
ncbi:NAD(P)/FAD-dependent oxidoreductase [Rhizobium skierniewicense]|uniref:NAD(P)/FAD-dependent oxidoreductase n=1 Tax=Rhizobium skierniewicense TaxID=984260 RepID=UPI0015724C55|nr:FAD-dependent oxidoreductase [Rhizobium skierniewicense]NTF34630.1 NAD(P)-binding protein [Rhizobium skierniewicense]